MKIYFDPKQKTKKPDKNISTRISTLFLFKKEKKKYKKNYDNLREKKNTSKIIKK